MSDFILQSPSEQVAEHLRSEIVRGRWSGTMPGSPTLTAELGVDSKAVWAALRILEKQGILQGQGAGRPRKIIPQGNDQSSIRVAILEYEPAGRTEDYMVDLRHRVEHVGHKIVDPAKTLLELDMNVSRIRHLVEETQADAWIVCAASRDVLEWFSKQDLPVFAFFGRRRQVPIAGVGPDHERLGREIIKQLVSLGHKRIVLIQRESRHSGGAGSRERAIIDEMAQHSLPFGPYNLPEWDGTPEGLAQVLEDLFRLTPPTALFIDEAVIFHAVMNHLARRGIHPPRDISLICSDPNLAFSWITPPIAHVRWDSRPVVRRAIDWVKNIAAGKPDLHQTLTKAELVEGGTIGPCPR